MRALVVEPGRANSAKLRDVPEPPPGRGSVLVEALALGVCGTDLEIVGGEYGAAPDGEDYLVLGHESLGRVLEAPAGAASPRATSSSASSAGLTRCRARTARSASGTCAGTAGTPSTGSRSATASAPSGTGSSRSSRSRSTRRSATLGVLLEPASVLAKAWEHVERIGRRAVWEPRRVLVTGAGPIGLLAALMGVQRGLEVHVLDRVTEGPKPGLVARPGRDLPHGRGSRSALPAPTSSSSAPASAGWSSTSIEHNGPGRRSSAWPASPRANDGWPVDVGGARTATMVLENDVVFGSVNANRRHYEAAAAALAAADRPWLGRLITRRVPLALARGPGTPARRRQDHHRPHGLSRRPAPAGGVAGASPGRRKVHGAKDVEGGFPRVARAVPAERVAGTREARGERPGSGRPCARTTSTRGLPTQGQSGFAWSWLGAALQATTLPFGMVNAPGQRIPPGGRRHRRRRRSRRCSWGGSGSRSGRARRSTNASPATRGPGSRHATDG